MADLDLPERTRRDLKLGGGHSDTRHQGSFCTSGNFPHRGQKRGVTSA